ncbi:MAG: hypothetical protein PHE25_05150 [Candidatus Gracilibacteria bacterium]|nr:hypothetical protein [Candidatus Gracilibacteria bacterium]
MNNIIHNTAIIEDGVIIGKNNYIGPFCYIKSGTIIGNNNRFEGYCSIGTTPEYYGKNYKETNVIIGNNNIFREFVIITNGTNINTIIKNNIILLNKTYIAHDSFIDDNVTCSCNVSIAGFVSIMKGANIGMCVNIHQNCIVGAYSMLGMGTIVTKKSIIEPGKIYVGNPAKYLKDNIIGLAKSEIDKNTLLKYEKEFYVKLKVIK